MVHVDQVPCGRGCLKPVLYPVRLGGGACDPVRFMRITIDNKESHRSPNKIVITLIVGQGKIIQVRLCVGGMPIVIAQGGEKTIRCRAGTI